VKRCVLRQKIRSGEITPKEYQKIYRPIRLAKEALEMKLSWSKHLYERRYFECCELKGRYRLFQAEKAKQCFGEFRLCNTGYIAKSASDEKDENTPKK
jgi:hypothetical protein